MAVGALAPVLGAVTGLAGAGLTFIGNLQSQKAQERAERARKRQAKLEATRTRREAIRRAQAARAASLANATNQGAAQSTAAQSAQAGITAQQGRQITATNQNLNLGLKVFEANEDFAKGQQLAGIGQGVGALGDIFTSNVGANQRVGQTLFGGNTIFG